MLLRATACHDEVASGTKAKLPLPTSFLLLHNIHKVAIPRDLDARP